MLLSDKHHPKNQDKPIKDQVLEITVEIVQIF